MESECFAYGVTAAGLSYSPYSNASSIPGGMLGSFGFDSRNSPRCQFYSPYSYHDSQDQITSTEATFSSNSSLDYSSYFTQLGASPFCVRDGLDEPLLNQNTVGNHHIRHALHELECALMAADDDEEVVITSQTHGNELDIASISDLKHLLIACAEALSENKAGRFEKLVEHARAAVSITGAPIERLGAYMLEGLIARKEASGTNIYRSFKCNEPDSADLLSYMHTLYQVCPYLKFSYMAANGAIAEACKNYNRIHIIDFQIAQGTQWTTLLQALAERPGGAPRVRITGVDDPVSRFARGAELAAIGERFREISRKFNIPVEFHPVPVSAPDVTREMLDIRAGEALAVNFPLQLHHTPDESVDMSNPRDGLLRMVKSLAPRVVTLVEQESNTNTAAFLPRFVETWDYYLAMFESLDVATTRESKERIDVEQHCLARDVVNMIACEGKERIERHELFGKWRSRFMMAGFEQCALSPYVNSVIRGLLRCYSEHYSLVERDGAMLLAWKSRNLISASAWH